MSEPRLCYIEGNAAFFTTQPVHEQWGDDWNDPGALALPSASASFRARSTLRLITTLRMRR